tara:strand:+ start:11983 stop:18120 length:6138 start_codon:yes stop_codon:yes gene_type:complete
MALDNHTTLSTKTLSAPNPISSVYKNIAFFDGITSNKLAFTNPTDLYDMEIGQIDNAFDFTSTSGIRIRGSLKGPNPLDATASTSNISGNISQLFKDVYGSIGQTVDANKYLTGVGSYPEVNTGSTEYTHAEATTAADRGLVWGLRQEVAQRYGDIARLNAELDQVEKLFGGNAWVWNTITDSGTTAADYWNANLEPDAGSYLQGTIHLKDALTKLDLHLKRNAILLQGVVNQLSGSEGSASEPYGTDTLEGAEWGEGNAPTLLDLGSLAEVADGSRNTNYIYSDGNAVNTRPGGGSGDTVISTSINSALVNLDKELRREENWTRNLTLYVDDNKSLDASDASGGALGWTHKPDAWSDLDNLTTGTYQSFGDDSTSLRDALNNLDRNMRLLEYKIDRNLDNGTVSPHNTLSANLRRESLGELRTDFDNLQALIGSGNTQAGTITYASYSGNTYADSNHIKSDINALDTEIEYLKTMVHGNTDAGNQYGTDDWGETDIKSALAHMHDLIISNTHSVKNRVAKVVQADSEIVFAADASAHNYHFRLKKGQGFDGTIPEHDGTTDSDWGYYAVNKNYVDGVTSGLIFRQKVKVVTFSNQTLSNGATIDGFALSNGHRVLCCGQTTTTDNGVWIVNTSGAWTRATDFAANNNALRTWTFWVQEGTVYENYHINIGGDNSTYEIGVDAMTGWTPISRALGLKDGRGTDAVSDRIHLNVGKSIYNDGTNGSDFEVYLAGAAGEQSGAPHTDAWTAGSISNKDNPIAYFNGTGSDRGLYLKYGSDFELSAAGNLKLANPQNAETTWAYSVTKFAESTNAGENSSGAGTSSYWDGAGKWEDLRALTSATVGQASQLGTDGFPKFTELRLNHTESHQASARLTSIGSGSENWRIGSYGTAEGTVNALYLAHGSAANNTLDQSNVKGGIAWNYDTGNISIINDTVAGTKEALYIDESGWVGIGGIGYLDDEATRKGRKFKIRHPLHVYTGFDKHATVQCSYGANQNSGYQIVAAKENGGTDFDDYSEMWRGGMYMMSSSGGSPRLSFQFKTLSSSNHNALPDGTDNGGIGGLTGWTYSGWTLVTDDYVVSDAGNTNPLQADLYDGSHEDRTMEAGETYNFQVAVKNASHFTGTFVIKLGDVTSSAIANSATDTDDWDTTFRIIELVADATSVTAGNVQIVPTTDCNAQIEVVGLQKETNPSDWGDVDAWKDEWLSVKAGLIGFQLSDPNTFPLGANFVVDGGTGRNDNVLAFVANQDVLMKLHSGKDNSSSHGLIYFLHGNTEDVRWKVGKSTSNAFVITNSDVSTNWAQQFVIGANAGDVVGDVRMQYNDGSTTGGAVRIGADAAQNTAKLSVAEDLDPSSGAYGRVLSLRRADSSGEIARFNRGSTIVGGLNTTDNGNGMAFYGGSWASGTETKNQEHLSIHKATHTPEAASIGKIGVNVKDAVPTAVLQVNATHHDSGDANDKPFTESAFRIQPKVAMGEGDGIGISMGVDTTGTNGISINTVCDTGGHNNTGSLVIRSHRGGEAGHPIMRLNNNSQLGVGNIGTDDKYTNWEGSQVTTSIGDIYVFNNDDSQIHISSGDPNGSLVQGDGNNVATLYDELPHQSMLTLTQARNRTGDATVSYGRSTIRTVTPTHANGIGLAGAEEWNNVDGHFLTLFGDMGVVFEGDGQRSFSKHNGPFGIFRPYGNHIGLTMNLDSNVPLRVTGGKAISTEDVMPTDYCHYDIGMLGANNSVKSGTTGGVCTWRLEDGTSVGRMLFGHDQSGHNIDIKSGIGGTEKGLSIKHTTGNATLDGDFSAQAIVAAAGTTPLTISETSANTFGINVSTTNNTTLRINNSGSGYMDLNLDGGSLEINGTTRINNSGIGTFSKLDISEANNGITINHSGWGLNWSSTSGSANQEDTGIKVSGQNLLYLRDNIERLKVTGTGDIEHTGSITSSGGGTNTFVGSVMSEGDVIAYSTSDERLKRNKRPIHHALDKVESLSGIMFDWDEELQNLYSGTDIGVIAQEVEEAVPQIVTTRDNGYKAVKYEKLVPLLIEAIKELSSEVKELKGKL